MKFVSLTLGIVFVLTGLAVVPNREVRAEVWVFYGGSGQTEVKDSTVRDWYGLNSHKPVSKAEAKTFHYYDRDSVASNSPFPGGVIRVWEKSVLQRETKSYEESREEIQGEEEKRLKRKITALDYAWLFPRAVNRASKEIATLFEINCDSLEFVILEVNTYDQAGQRMTRETNNDMVLSFPIQEGTMMEILSQDVCTQ